MSEAMNLFARMAANMPLDVTNHEELMTGLSTSIVSLAFAIDKEEISFHSPGAGGAVYGMAAICFQLLHGKPVPVKVSVN